MDQLKSYLISDVADLPIGQIVTRFEIWSEKSILHVFMGAIGFFVYVHRRSFWNWMYRPEWWCWVRRPSLWFYGIQVVQTIQSPGGLLTLMLDAAWDIGCLWLGVLIAYWVAMRRVRK